MQMSDPIDVIISVMNGSVNSFQFNSCTVSLGRILSKIHYSRHLATPCNFNTTRFVLAQRTNSRDLSHVD